MYLGMKERNGVRIGQAVRDLDGKELGRVTALHDWAFSVSKGHLLFRRDTVARYDEIRGVRDGALVLARSARDLDELAAGRIPPSWRIATPPGFPASATPSEARFVFDHLAARALPPRAVAAPVPPPPEGGASIAPEDERSYAQGRGQADVQAPQQP
jgi:hypothetical protein